MHRILLHITGLLALALALPSPAQSNTRVPLTSLNVAAALAGRGMPVDAAQIDMPPSLTSAGADPHLQVTGADLLPDGRVRLRLGCREAGQCQPFLVVLRSPSATEAFAGLLRPQGLSGEISQPARLAHSAAADRMVAGQHATLLLEDSHMRISVPVLVIDSGAPGTEVRVSSLDHKQVYRAVVADPATLRGTLP